MANGNGIKLNNGLQWLIVALIAGGFGIGGTKFVNKDTSDSIATLDKRSAVIEQKVRSLETINDVKEQAMNEKLQDIKEDVSELKDEFKKFQEEQRAVNQTLMKTMRKLLEKDK